MRKLVAGLFTTLDGVVSSPENWQFRYADEEQQALIGAQMAESDTILLGRVTYEGFAAYWPHQDTEMARQMNAVNKVVVSTTLPAANWQNTTLVRSLQDVKALKEKPGRNITVTGSVSLVRSLLEHRLLDELGLMLHPVVLGAGTRLFEPGGTGHTLRLVTSKALRSGVVSLTYQPADTGS